MLAFPPKELVKYDTYPKDFNIEPELDDFYDLSLLLTFRLHRKLPLGGSIGFFIVIRLSNKCYYLDTTTKTLKMVINAFPSELLGHGTISKLNVSKFPS